jgi:hypothetical protein
MGKPQERNRITNLEAGFDTIMATTMISSGALAVNV